VYELARYPLPLNLIFHRFHDTGAQAHGGEVGAFHA
jgi:hypothetical protein